MEVDEELNLMSKQKLKETADKDDGEKNPFSKRSPEPSFPDVG